MRTSRHNKYIMVLTETNPDLPIRPLGPKNYPDHSRVLSVWPVLPLPATAGPLEDQETLAPVYQAEGGRGNLGHGTSSAVPDKILS